LVILKPLTAVISGLAHATDYWKAPSFTAHAGEIKMEIKFGPAGNSQSYTDAGFKATVDAPRWLHEMGLTAYEYQCGRGVNIGEDTARKIGAQAALYDIALSLHAPYYINLSSREDERIEKNIGYVLASCRA